MEIFTYVECPSEKKVPTVTGFWPVASNLRVIKSMACTIVSKVMLGFA